MTSIGSRTRQISTDGGYYVPLADIRSVVYAINTSVSPPTFATASWTDLPIGFIQSTLRVGATGNSLLKDMGKTVVSASRTFRKIQLVASTTSTFGVAGPASGTDQFYTGYIELGLEGYGSPARVAQVGR